MILPIEIIERVFSFMAITDLTKVEHVCRLYQSLVLKEIKNRVLTCKKDWGLLVHLDQIYATPTFFDPVTKKAHFSTTMNPVQIKLLFDHRRPIHCSLLKNRDNKYTSYDEKVHVFTIEKGMKEGRTKKITANNNSCQIHAELTKLTSSTDSQPYLSINGKQVLQLAPNPIIYTLQIKKLILPLSTLS